jgi:hypothetical protein
MSFARYSELFLEKLHLGASLPQGVSVMVPYASAGVMRYTRAFYHKYYADGGTRRLLIGINPGRFGGGVTGIPFTDPIRLQSVCGIDNDLPKKSELSSIFIYEMIEAYGGASRFYSDFLITAVSPLGYVRDGKNMNYYDDPDLHRAVEPFILNCFKKQVDMGADQQVAWSLGRGQNHKYLTEINRQYQFFEKIIPLPHPRWILQYRRKRKAEFIDLYLDRLGAGQ